MSNKSDYPNSKKITIFRAGSFISRAHGPEAQEFFNLGKVSVDSFFEKRDSRKIATGLTANEENLLLPSYVDASPEEREFRKNVATFYMDISTKIPPTTGLILEIGLETSNDSPVSKSNMPYDTMDYIRYKHAIGHPFMANNKEEAESNPTKQYYIFDPTQVQTKNKKRSQDQDAAMQIYLQMKEEPEQVDIMLTLMGIDPREFTGSNAVDLRVEELRKLAETKFVEFNRIQTEGDIKIRYLIKTMEKVGILKSLGERRIDGETKKIIGNSLEETIAWFQDEDANSDYITMYKAKMQEALRKPFVAGKKKTIVTR